MFDMDVNGEITEFPLYPGSSDVEEIHNGTSGVPETNGRVRFNEELFDLDDIPSDLDEPQSDEDEGGAGPSGVSLGIDRMNLNCDNT